MPPAQTERCIDETARPRTILLVDDDKNFLLIHEKILMKAGYHVLTAETGEEGLDMARRSRPDVVLHDIDLPDGIGLDFGSRIKDDPVCGPTRLLFISGIKIAPEDKAAGLRAGADGYLFKPIHKEELLAQIESVLRARQAETKLLHQVEVNHSLAVIAKTLTLPDTDLADMAEVVMDQARRLTGSEEGYVSSIDPVSKDNVVHTFSEMMGGGLCQVRDKRITFPRGRDGYPCLWGHCLNTSKGFYTNSPRAHPSSAGLPEGHLPLRRFLSVPALYEGQVYGQIALANADRDYTDEDVNMLGSMAHLFAASVSRKFSRDALRKSEEQYRMIVETANEGIRVQDPEGRITFVNKKLADMLGRRPEELLGRPVIESIHPDEKQDYLQRIRNRRMGISEVYERRNLHENGSTIWTKVSATPIFDEKNRYVGSFAMISDITERKRSEEQIRKLSMAVEQSPTSIVITDLQANIEYVNPAFTNLTGYTFDEVIGQNPRVLKSPDRLSRDYRELWVALTSGKQWRGEFKNIKKNGEVFWESASIAPVFNDQGQATHYLAIKEDITTRKQIEAKLLELNMAVEQSGDGIALADLDGHIRFVNTAWVELHGYTVQELMGQHLSIFHTPEQMVKEVEPFNKRLFAKGTNRGEVGHAHKDGSTFPVHMSVTIAKDATGKPFGLLAAARDITEQKIMEESLRAAQIHAEAASKAKSEFLANMSHEIRTPMNGVIGMTGLLLDTDLSPEQRRFTETIQFSGESLLSLINNILDYSKIEAGRLDIESLDFDLHDLLDDVSASLALRAQDKGLEYISHISPDVPHLLRGDPGRLRQILTNLVGNAVKFTERGEVVVSVQKAEGNAGMLEFWDAGIGEVHGSRIGEVHGSRFNGSAVEETAVDGADVGAHRGAPDGVAPNAKHPDTTTAPTVNREPLNPEPFDREPLNPEPNVMLRFTVRDTGIGIPEDKNDLLFDKFSQVDASITRKFGGTGLGLAISKQLAEMMGGEVGVNSALGQGSEFWFTARFVLQESAADQAFMPPRDLTGLHVLVVDDNATNLEILLKQFAAWGMKPHGVDGGEEALRAAAATHDRAAPFDLAVVDFQMPGMDGGELARRLKADPRFQAMPLVMLTSLGRPGDARMCADLGFTAYLNKPVRQSELYDTLALVMADTGRRTPSNPIITRHMARENQRRQATLPRFSGRVLLAEDNPVNQQVALGILKKFGLHADTVSNGREALHALQTNRYDLVFMDVRMPEMDGLCATREIRRLETDNAGMLECWDAGIGKTGRDAGMPESQLQVSGLSPHPSRRTPVIAMTAGAMREDRERCFEAGMDDYVAKPVKPENLARVLGKWLPEGRGQKAEGRGQKAEVRSQWSDVRCQVSEGRRQEAEDALPVFERSTLLNRCMDDEDLVQQVLGMFLDNMPQRTQELQAALNAGDAPAARMAAHSIKGMAANTSAEALRALAGEMEDAAEGGDLDTVRARMVELSGIFEELRKVLVLNLGTAVQRFNGSTVSENADDGIDIGATRGRPSAVTPNAAHSDDTTDATVNPQQPLNR